VSGAGRRQGAEPEAPGRARGLEARRRDQLDLAGGRVEAVVDLALAPLDHGLARIVVEHRSGFIGASR